MKALHPPLLLTLLCMLASPIAAAPAPQVTLSEKVVSFCQQREGEQVGNGQCAALATEALRFAGAKGRGPDHPAKGDYTWGQQIFFLEVSARERKIDGKPADIQAGDIIQFRDTRWVSKRGRGSYTMTFQHHTA